MLILSFFAIGVKNIRQHFGNQPNHECFLAAYAVTDGTILEWSYFNKD